ncbi:hypothetical protein OH807_40150 [Kitasatospora sp. NBC_01560]|uniref:hypothetical protein n=1 Tax=Kitasatospora sp. NBC_01560 TaxID=2975965 RepID=UPI00386F45BD
MRRAIGEVATASGVCLEPSNVAECGHACPLRFRCVGCDHVRTDVSSRRKRVAGAIPNTAKNGISISVSGIARQARTDRTFLYQHRDLLALVHTAEREPAGHDPAGASPVNRASLQTDLANAQAHNTCLTARVQQLERRLSQASGAQAWRESGLGSV